MTRRTWFAAMAGLFASRKLPTPHVHSKFCNHVLPGSELGVETLAPYLTDPDAWFIDFPDENAARAFARASLARSQDVSS